MALFLLFVGSEYTARTNFISPLSCERPDEISIEVKDVCGRGTSDLKKRGLLMSRSR